MAPQQRLELLDGRGIVALIARDQREVVMRPELVGLQTNALAQVGGSLGQTALRVQHRAERILQQRVVRARA